MRPTKTLACSAFQTSLHELVPQPPCVGSSPLGGLDASAEIPLLLWLQRSKGQKPRRRGQLGVLRDAANNRGFDSRSPCTARSATVVCRAVALITTTITDKTAGPARLTTAARTALAAVVTQKLRQPRVLTETECDSWACAVSDDGSNETAYMDRPVLTALSRLPSQTRQFRNQAEPLPDGYFNEKAASFG